MAQEAARQRVAHACAQPDRGLRQRKVQVGTGSVQAVRRRRAAGREGGKKGPEEGWRGCLPQGQWVVRAGKSGQGEGVREGGWQGWVH